MAKGRKRRKKNSKMLEVLVILVFGIGLLIAVLKIGQRASVPYQYNDLIEKYSKENEVEKELLAAIIYQESRFNKDATSNRDARGLMQIIPETGEWVSEKLNTENFSKEDLYDPNTNIKIGSMFIKHLLDYYKGNEKLAIAAYNAGPGNVDEWLKDGTVSENGDISEIPFQETRKYVEVVLKMKGVYKEMYPEEFKNKIDSYENKYINETKKEETTKE